jgi:hypothetical protein
LLVANPFALFHWEQVTFMPELVDAGALRQQLSLSDEVDTSSPEFLRFVIRFSEALDLDIPEHDRPRLVTLAGCLEYLAANREAWPGR